MSHITDPRITAALQELDALEGFVRSWHRNQRAGLTEQYLTFAAAIAAMGNNTTEGQPTAASAPTSGVASPLTVGGDSAPTAASIAAKALNKDAPVFRPFVGSAATTTTTATPTPTPQQGPNTPTTAALGGHSFKSHSSNNTLTATTTGGGRQQSATSGLDWESLMGGGAGGGPQLSTASPTNTTFNNTVASSNGADRYSDPLSLHTTAPNSPSAVQTKQQASNNNNNNNRPSSSCSAHNNSNSGGTPSSFTVGVGGVAPAPPVVVGGGGLTRQPSNLIMRSASSNSLHHAAGGNNPTTVKVGVAAVAPHPAGGGSAFGSSNNNNNAGGGGADYDAFLDEYMSSANQQQQQRNHHGGPAVSTHRVPPSNSNNNSSAVVVRGPVSPSALESSLLNMSSTSSCGAASVTVAGTRSTVAPPSPTTIGGGYGGSHNHHHHNSANNNNNNAGCVNPNFVNVTSASQLQASGATSCQVLVEFKRKRVLQFESKEFVTSGEFVVVGGDRGEDIGVVTHVWPTGSAEPTGAWNGNIGIGKVLRPATLLEISQLQGVQFELESRAVEVAQEKVVEHQLPMRIVDAEYQFDRKKLTFYYQSNHRLDFRNLVRDLYKTFRARIWMEQD